MKIQAKDKAEKEEEKQKERKKRKKAQKSVCSSKGKRPLTMSGGNSTLPTADSELKLKISRCTFACFGLYCDDAGTGRDWLKCVCGRWIREECVDDNVVCYVNGQEKVYYIMFLV